jgi:hypothetical protein
MRLHSVRRHADFRSADRPLPGQRVSSAVIGWPKVPQHPGRERLQLATACAEGAFAGASVMPKLGPGAELCSAQRSLISERDPARQGLARPVL